MFTTSAKLQRANLGCTLTHTHAHPHPPTPTGPATFTNAGTAGGTPHSFDCASRTYAYEYGKRLAPSRGAFRTLFDALQLQACNHTIPEGPPDSWRLVTTPSTRCRSHTLYLFITPLPHSYSLSRVGGTGPLHTCCTC